MGFEQFRKVVVFAAILLPGASQAQVELRGRVVSETGEPIAGATITLQQIGYAIRTDSSGAFALAGTPGSILVFVLRATGYRGDTASVTLPRRSGLSREFKL